MIKAIVKALLSGGIGYVQGGIIVGGALAAVWFYADYKHTKKANKTLRQDVALLKVEAGWKDQVIAGALATNDRREGDRAQQLTVEDIINAMPETNYCSASPAIVAALGELRDRRGATTAPDP